MRILLYDYGVICWGKHFGLGLTYSYFVDGVHLLTGAIKREKKNLEKSDLPN